MAEFLYKPGDKVRVIDRFIQFHEYKMLSGPKPGSTTTVKWTYEKRCALAGSVVTISGYAYGDRYRVVETGGNGSNIDWTDEMFVGLDDDKECYCSSLL